MPSRPSNVSRQLQPLAVGRDSGIAPLTCLAPRSQTRCPTSPKRCWLVSSRWLPSPPSFWLPHECPLAMNEEFRAYACLSGQAARGSTAVHKRCGCPGHPTQPVVPSRDVTGQNLAMGPVHLCAATAPVSRGSTGLLGCGGIFTVFKSQPYNSV